MYEKGFAKTISRLVWDQGISEDIVIRIVGGVDGDVPMVFHIWVKTNPFEGVQAPAEESWECL